MDIPAWLESIELGRYTQVFLENEIDQETLLSLSDDELKHDLGISPLGHRRKILREIQALKRTGQQAWPERTEYAPIFLPQIIDGYPYPLAVSYDKLQKSEPGGHSLETLFALKDCFEIITRYLPDSLVRLSPERKYQEHGN